MTDFSCKHCRGGRFIGQGYGVGRVRLQCKACGRWQWVEMVEDHDKREVQGVAQIAHLA